ncbi:hypothetical protein U370_04975 [Anaplasma marginale str. Dawn]|uniref:Uncharacterized protein n=2 Tax=Anaplasma marginale TaxID=770 RepID=A0A643CM12_ANAMA|nr:hypothetical protein [Anaplasma marginale]AGZ79273.1 hypothetical protein U128_05190 [Anaplasma marginale str. Gypsy Plains]AGZ80066.1 hypothetical protein U370_04975 [Anaplasma marginale str. Dawn]AXW84480.1 hypothetical protein CQZ76_05105 [Anaplasma marginale]AXW85413.1 hypothetical protein BKM88_05085 [Anaplasma marginale]KAA8472844.1 hypothetical protein F0Q58_01005 [Anaplasma marginale]
MYAVAVVQLLQQYQVVLAALVLFVIFFTAAQSVRGAGFGHAPAALREKSTHGQLAPPAPAYPASRNPAEPPTLHGGTEVAPPDSRHKRVCHADDQARATAAFPRATPVPHTGCGGGSHSTKQPPVGHIAPLSRGCSAKVMVEPSTKCALYSLEVEPSQYELVESTEEAIEMVEIAYESCCMDISEPAPNEAQLYVVEEGAIDTDQEPFSEVESANTLMYCIAVDQVFPHQIAKMLQHG